MSTTTSRPHPRNVFEVDNARNMSAKEIVGTFLPTPGFWRLLTKKNHIVMGARGSGKTVLTKMLAHDHLSLFQDARAQDVIDSRRLIGIYVPTKMEWVSALRNKPWDREADAEMFFQWRLNLSVCSRFIVTLKSCLRRYFSQEEDRARREIDVARAISRTWSDGERTCNTLNEVERYLEETEYRMQTQLARRRVTGSLRPGEEQAGMAFYTELFVPLRRAMTLVSEPLELPPDVSWLLCLDEAEFLDEFHHRILNTHLRADSGNVFFKISTMPYHHKTAATNTTAALEVGQDFEYVYIDRDLLRLSPHGDDAGEAAALEILERRANLAGRPLDRETLSWCLGPSPLLDPMKAEWQRGTRMMRLIQEYGDPVLRSRAARLIGKPSFRDQISRKIRGALVLREAVANTRGNTPLAVYSGLRLAIRCSDANPRRLIRIFNLLLLRATQGGDGLQKLTPNQQTAILTELSQSVLNRTWSHPRIGRHLYMLLNRIGSYCSAQYHTPLRTDQISALEIDEDVAEEDWEAIRTAVGIGLLFPSTTPSKGDPMPERRGTFHLAYVLAPAFRVLPRRGKARRLETILRTKPVFPDTPESVAAPIQLGFGLEGPE